MAACIGYVRFPSNLDSHGVSESMKDNTASAGNAGALLPTDAQLVEQTMAGKRQAYDELVRRHQRRALAVSYRLLGNSHDAAEVTQDAFLKAYASLRTLDDPQRFGGWLMRIVANLSLNRRRGRKRTTALPVDDILGGGNGQSAASVADSATATGRADDPYQQLEGKELGRRLLEALDQLPEKQRMAIVLFTINQMPQKDIAKAMDSSVEAVKWHVFQGRKKLREILKDLITEQ